MKKDRKPQVPTNNLQKIRQQEGFTIKGLAELSQVSDKLVSETERSLRDPKDELKYRILNALNQKYNPPKYNFKDLFPNHEA